MQIPQSKVFLILRCLSEHRNKTFFCVYVWLVPFEVCRIWASSTFSQESSAYTEWLNSSYAESTLNEYNAKNPNSKLSCLHTFKVTAPWYAHAPYLGIIKDFETFFPLIQKWLNEKGKFLLFSCKDNQKIKFATNSS